RALAARLVGTQRRHPRALARSLPPAADDPAARDRAAAARHGARRQAPDARTDGVARRLDARRWLRAGAAGQFRRHTGVPWQAGRRRSGVLLGSDAGPRTRAGLRRVPAASIVVSRLDQLRHVAGLLGIATRHVDALGVTHEPNEETLAALIAAFGLPTDPRQAANALAEEQHSAPFGLAPAHVLAQEMPDPV